MDLNSLLLRAVEEGASDIHLKRGKPPMARIDGSIAPLADLEPLGDADLEDALNTVTSTSPERLEGFRETNELDIAYQSELLPRFRVNVFRQRGAISLAFRAIPRAVPSLDDLGMPPGVQRLAEEHHGLVLVTGATGAGKSTTLAAILDHFNRTRRQHIVTIEDPIEILHSDHASIVSQREVGLDTESFEQALRRALRQDPDVILIGELRDAETAQTALQAAESGHLVLSTLHTVDAAETIGRLVEFFPAVKQPMIRSILAGVLKGVVSQRLLPKVSGGRVAAVEVMITNDRIADLIREDRADEIPDAMADGAYYDMQPLAKALIDLALSGLVEREIAANAAPNPHDFEIALSHAEKARAAAAAAPALTPDDYEPEPVRAPEPDPEPLRLVRVPAAPPFGG
ncbi:MAG: type IV pilus twitching motility protein PilT [Gaiellaceae bacterium]